MRNKASWLVRTVLGVSLIAGASSAIASESSVQDALYRDLLKAEYNSGQKAGYKEGYQDGKKAGYTEGYGTRSEEVVKELKAREKQEADSKTAFSLGGLAFGFLMGWWVFHDRRPKKASQSDEPPYEPPGLEREPLRPPHNLGT